MPVADQETEWYRKSIEETARLLDTSPQDGLSEAEAARRLQQYGYNELLDRGGKSPLKILLEQLTGIMTMVLFIAGAISLVLGDKEDAIAILAIIILNTVLGFSQEYRAEKAMAALKKMSAPVVKVRRDGHTREISSREVVPGDVVLLEAGNLVPADGRLAEAVNLRVQEAVLTGESEPVEKITAVLEKDHLPLGDQRNRAFMGTLVTYGRGTLIITETGMRTELGKIAEMLQTVEQEKTPMQKRLEQLARTLALAALGIVILVFVLGILRGEDIRLMFLTAVSMAVAAIPEGLPTVVTIGLALGAQTMLRRKALIRKLPAVETLGSVTTICSDKTGTLTENRMTVTVLDVANHELDLKEQVQNFSPRVRRDQVEPVLRQNGAIPLLLTVGALCNDAVLEADPNRPDEYSSVGDPTEGALVIAAARAGLWKEELEHTFPRVAELPFDSDRKRMTTVHRVPQDALPDLFAGFFADGRAPFIALTKGSVDGMLEVSAAVWVDGRVIPMDEQWRERIRANNDRLARGGMRVLGMAYRLRSSDAVNLPDDPLESGLIFIGMAAMMDPARPEVFDAVRVAKQAGIRPIMITGDHPLTALAIARELGIATSERVVTGTELALMDVPTLAQVVKEVSVFARVSPEHKLKIVEALQSHGEIVAMTGDGVNDAPALKKADIGVAMGITGTDVSKEAADMVLLDDNFATIVAAVEEGRRIYENIRKFIRYTLGSNLGEILVVLGAPFLGMPIPLTPLQILWVNLVTDGLPGLALTVEQAERGTMQRPPHPPQENVFARGLWSNIFYAGFMMTLLTLTVGYGAWSMGVEAWRTMAFTTLTLAQMGNALALRTGNESVFREGFFRNRAMIGAVLLTFVLQLAVIYVPFLQPFFATQALSAAELGVCLLASAAMFGLVELEKRLRR